MGQTIVIQANVWLLKFVGLKMRNSEITSLYFQIENVYYNEYVLVVWLEKWENGEGLINNLNKIYFVQTSQSNYCEQRLPS